MKEITENTVRKAFQYCAEKCGYHVEYEMHNFDLWLTNLKAQIWDEGFDGGIDHAVLKENVFNPYREAAP